MQVFVKGIRHFRPQVRLNAANSQVHEGQLPGVGFLTIDADVAHLAAVSFDELSDWTNMPPEPQQGS
jgi:hypothetical protein